MLANIRVRHQGNSILLPRSVDLLRFSEEQIRERLVDYDYPYDSELFVRGFADWELPDGYALMSLPEAYMLRDVLTKVYDGDEHIIVHLLSRKFSVEHISTNFYKFIGTDEVQAVQNVTKYVNKEGLISLFFKCHNWVSFCQAFLDQGYLVHTDKGFYLNDDLS